MPVSAPGFSALNSLSYCLTSAFTDSEADTQSRWRATLKNQYVPVDNLYIIVSELNKLFLYCDGKINLEDVSLCTSKMIKCNIFDLINAIVSKNIDLSLELYDDLVILNEEEIKLIITLANQFRLIYQVKCMFKSGYSEKDIASELGVHPYRVKLANSVNTDERTILNYLKRLSILDENIKTGKINKREGFINFILSI